MCFVKFHVCEANHCNSIHSVEMFHCRSVIEQNNLHTLDESFRVKSFFWSPMKGCEGLQHSSYVAVTGLCDEHDPEPHWVSNGPDRVISRS